MASWRDTPDVKDFLDSYIHGLLAKARLRSIADGSHEAADSLCYLLAFNSQLTSEEAQQACCEFHTSKEEITELATLPARDPGSETANDR
jgi:hypothetical protein